MLQNFASCHIRTIRPNAKNKEPKDYLSSLVESKPGRTHICIVNFIFNNEIRNSRFQ